MRDFYDMIIGVCLFVVLWNIFCALLPFELPTVEFTWRRGEGWTVTKHGFRWKNPCD
jgi:hypothetical protein